MIESDTNAKETNEPLPTDRLAGLVASFLQERSPAVRDYAAFLQECFNSQGRGKTGRTHGRQHMVRSGQVIAGSLRRIVSQKYSPGMLNGMKPGIRFFDHQLQVFCCYFISHIYGLMQIIGY